MATNSLCTKSFLVQVYSVARYWESPGEGPSLSKALSEGVHMKVSQGSARTALIGVDATFASVQESNTEIV